jgi:hypothetical protein
MEQTFFRFRWEGKKSAIEIKTKIEYERYEILGLNSTLIKNNNFAIGKGKKLFDFIHFMDDMNFAISKRVKELLEANAVTGWKCFPIVIKDLPEEYYAFQNMGCAGRILNLEDINNRVSENREFDINTWDGSDIFNLDNTLLNVCTPRVKEILEKAKLTNMMIEPL